MNAVPQIIPFTSIDALKAAGIHYPSTRPQLDWMFRTRHENGLADAFAVINGRKLFKPQRYLELTGAVRSA